MTTHRITTGEVPRVGLRVLDYDRKWGTIVEVRDGEVCGHLCLAWHRVRRDDGHLGSFNCCRLASHSPGYVDPHPAAWVIEGGQGRQTVARCCYCQATDWLTNLERDGCSYCPGVSS